MKTTIRELLVRTASAALKMQSKAGSMPPGHNGPYFDRETPVRNTAHWLVTFTKVFEITREKQYRRAAEKGIKYLLSEEARPHGKSFYCRKGGGGDSCNGLIGQAWATESLAYAGRILGIEKAVDLAQETFLLHEFNSNEGLWYIHEIDKQTNKIDPTLNHQIYFASSGVEIKNKKIDQIIGIFLDNLDQHFKIDMFGMIKHLMPNRYDVDSFKVARSLIGNTLLSLDQLTKPEKIKEIGYHQFNLMGLTFLSKRFPDHSFWNSKFFRKSLKALCSDYYIKRLENNIYGYPYNVAGIEAAFVLQEFLPKEKSLRQRFLERQFRHYDTKNNELRLKTSDSETLSARIYEAVRLNDTVVSL